MAIAGGCLCGAVRYAIKAEAPLGARHCWCRVCQYLGAGTGAVSAAFRTEDVAVSGPLTDYVCKADSGSTMHLRARGHARRSRPRGAHRDHLAPVGAEMGMLRPRSAADRRTAAAVEGLKPAAGADPPAEAGATNAHQPERQKARSNRILRHRRRQVSCANRKLMLSFLIALIDAALSVRRQDG